MLMQTLKVDIEQVLDPSKVWFHVEPYIEKAINRVQSTYTLEKIYTDLMTQRMQLWITRPILSCAITQIIENQDKICLILFCGGQFMEDWSHYIEVIENWADNIGCDYVEISGRPGWEKVFPEYKRTSITLRKDLRDGTTTGS